MKAQLFQNAHAIARRSTVGTYGQRFSNALRTEWARFRRLSAQACNWFNFALPRSNQREATLSRKAFDAVRVAFAIGSESIAIPTKVRGISAHQDAAMNASAGDPLHIVRRIGTDGPRHLVLHGGNVLGTLDAKYDAWMLDIPAQLIAGVVLQQTGRPETETGESRLVGVNFAVTFRGTSRRKPQLVSLPKAAA